MDRSLETQAERPSDVEVLRRPLSELRDLQCRLAQAEEAFRAAERRCEELTQAVTDYVFVVRMDGGRPVRTTHSPTCLGVTGYSQDEFESDPYLWFRMVREEDRWAVQDQADTILHRHEAHPLEHRIVRKDGAVRWVRNTPVLHYDPEGRLIAYQGLIEDITERKQAEEALRESEERYRSLYNNTPVMLHTIDHDGRIIEASNFWLEKLGYEREEVVGHSMMDFMTDLSRRYAKRVALPEFLENGSCKDVPYQFVRKGGQVMDTLMSAVAERDQTGKMIRSLAVLTDVTERRRAEKQLRLTQFSIDHASDTVFWIDSNGRFCYVNGAACEALGYTREELLRLGISDVIPDYTADRWSVDWALLREQGDFKFEACHRRKDGSTFPVEISANHVEFGDGEYNFIFARDISERKRAEEDRVLMESRLRQVQKMEAIGQLAGGVAHDFNNLLTAILGNVELMRDVLIEQPSKDPSILTALDQVEKAGLRAAALTRQLLSFSRRKVVAQEMLDPNRILVDLDSILRRLIGEHIALRIGGSSGLRPLWGDSSQIEQALLNLALNARDAMPSGGSLTIEAENVTLSDEPFSGWGTPRAGAHIMFSVKDTGCGMSKTVLERMFEPFFTTKPVGKGTGLGLSIVYGVVNQLSGGVAVESQPEQGTTFKLYLPAVDSSEWVAADKAQGDTPPGGHETILICEDEESVAQLTRQVLTRGGYTVLSATNGREAMELANRHTGPIDLLVTDVIMPEMNGRELAERLSAVRSGIEVLYVSGYTSDLIAQHGIQSERVHFLGKPFDRNGLLSLVRRVLDKRAG